jgi:formylglycine-generating enzyme required for sulfatase activity
VSAAILADARDEVGALPLVENALYRLWQFREPDPLNKDRSRLSGKRYQVENGIAGMLSVEADQLLSRIDGQVPRGRWRALEVLLRLTRVDDLGRHSRHRITLDDAVFVAGRGDDGIGKRVVNLLSGERRLDAPTNDQHGALRLITIHVDFDAREQTHRPFVDMIHETLVRARGGYSRKEPLVLYWPTLHDYIERNRDRDISLQQLKIQARRWSESRWLGRLWHLEALHVGRYRSLAVRPHTPDARFLFWSRFTQRAWAASLLALMLWMGQAYLWVASNGLPIESMLLLQRFRLGYAPTPAMVDIKPGMFELGEHDEGYLKTVNGKDLPKFGTPHHPITIEHGFRLGRFEVTYDEYDYFVWRQHRAGHDKLKFPATAGGGRGSHPVVNVTWHDAVAYVRWLGTEIGEDCRLPTEAEWEYSARGGTTTAHWWGDALGTNRANCQKCGSLWDNEEAAPVGSFAPNPFGLYDVLGNVWEWTCSAWGDVFEGDESRCVSDEEPRARVLHGGSWTPNPAGVRSAARFEYEPDDRSSDLGLRALCLPRDAPAEN